MLYHESQWQGSRPYYKLVTNKEAAIWLVTNNHESHLACAKEYAELEVE